MQTTSVLLSSILLFTSLAAATSTFTVSIVQERTSYSVVDTVIRTGSAPAGYHTPYVPSTQVPLTTLGVTASTESAPSAKSQTSYLSPSQTPSQTSLTTTLSLNYSSNVAPSVYPTVGSTGVTTPAGNYSLPTAPVAPTKTKTAVASTSATGAAARGFSASIGMVAAIGVVVAMVGPL